MSVKRLTLNGQTNLATSLLMFLLKDNTRINYLIENMNGVIKQIEIKIHQCLVYRILNNLLLYLKNWVKTSRKKETKTKYIRTLRMLGTIKNLTLIKKNGTKNFLAINTFHMRLLSSRPIFPK